MPFRLFYTQAAAQEGWGQGLKILSDRKLQFCWHNLRWFMWRLDPWHVEQPNHLEINGVYRKEMKGLQVLCPVFLLSCRWIQIPTLTFACMTLVPASLSGTARVSATPSLPTRTPARRRGWLFTGGRPLCAVSTQNLRQSCLKTCQVLAQTSQI